MSWVNRRIKEYREGDNPTFIEKSALEHGNPFNFVLTIVALVLFSYGLWMHDWTWIVVGLITASIGHIYCRIQK